MTKHTNRRQFLQASAALGGAFLLGRNGAFASPHFPPSQSRLFLPESIHREVHPCVFTPLAPGQVKPTGWIRDWATDAANGITGHLDEHSATIQDAWKGFPFDAFGVNPDGTGWPLEQCSYWLDGAIRLGYALDDSALIAKASARLDYVVNGVLKGGETFIYWRPASIIEDSFNAWAHSHMGRALVAYYQGSRNPKVLAALTKVYRNFPIEDLSPTFYGTGGAVNLDAMSETFRMSGDPAILQNMLAYAARQSYRATADAWADGNLQVGHNVIFYEHVRTPAMLYPWTGNARDLSATVSALRWNDKNNMLPMGLSSGEEYQAGIGSTRNVETCNVAAGIWTNLWLARVTGQSGWLDRIEQIFFNAGPAPVSHDFKIMSYYQRPNRYNHNLPEEPANPGKGCYQFTEIGDPVLCCVGNINRVIPTYIMHMWMETRDGGIAATLHGPSRVKAMINGNVPVAIESNTRYPFEESIEFTVNPDHPVSFPLYLRIPEWAGEPEIFMNDSAYSANASQPGFRVIKREWRQGDRVRLILPMSIRIQRGYETPYPQIPYFRVGREISLVREMHNPWASVFFGPLLFSLPIPSVSPNEEIPGTQINYAIDVRSDKPTHAEAGIFKEAVFPWAHYEWICPGPLQLGINAQEVDWTPTELQPIPRTLVSGKRTRIVLVPYACTKFGISMFPRTS